MSTVPISSFDHCSIAKMTEGLGIEKHLYHSPVLSRETGKILHWLISSILFLVTLDLAKHTDNAHADHSPLLSAVESLKTVMK